MLEMMMLGGKKKVEIPTELGPGGQELLFSYSRNADQTAGYFGRVAAADLITGADLYTLLGRVGGSQAANAVDKGWMKFLIDGKIIFVAQACFYTGMSFTSLVSKNVVTGDLQVTIDGYVFKVRLLSGTVINNDPSVVTTGSEWNRLMYAITTISAPAEVENGVKWDNFTGPDLGISSNIGVWNLCQEVYYYTSNPGNYQIYRGNSYNNITNVGGVYKQTSDTRNGWRPVLELVGKT